MRERGILFNGPMVRAVLAGKKTQTRRIVKPQPDWDSPKPCCETTRDGFQGAVNRGMWSCGGTWTDDEDPRRCPYGQPGDRLWVREAWNKFPPWEGYFYAADDHSFGIGECDDSDHIEPHDLRWKPSTNMPREASRLTLEITEVRVERLNEISEGDAEAEGCFALGDADCTAVEQFRRLWESINGPGSWALNPFVWVITFRRVGL